MENQQPTIKDIAKMAGVSIATVDRVLHNRGKVSKKNLDLISAAIETLSYKPNQIARALSSRKSNIKIGLVLPQVESDFWGEIIEGVQAAQAHLSPFGVELITEFSYSYDLDEQLKSINQVLKMNVNGLIMTPLYDGSRDIVDRCIPKEVPYATVIDDMPGSRRLFHIGPDDFAIGNLAARLTELYCRPRGNVVILSPNNSLIETQQRISGFVSKVKQEQLALNILQIIPIPGKTEKCMYQNIYITALECIKNGHNLDAFYVTNGLTQWCADAVVESGLVGKVKVIGHEYTSKLPQYLQSGAISAVIYQKPAMQFYKAINLLYEYIIGDQRSLNDNIITECNIIIKENISFVHNGGNSQYGYC